MYEPKKSVKDVVVVLVCGLALLFTLVNISGCSTFKAVGGVIYAVGEDVQGLGSAVEEHQRSH